MVKKGTPTVSAPKTEPAPPRHSTAGPLHHETAPDENRLFNKREDIKVNTGLRLEPEMMERLRDAAYIERCTKAEVIRRAVIEYLDNHHSGPANLPK